MILIVQPSVHQIGDKRNKHTKQIKKLFMKKTNLKITLLSLALMLVSVRAFGVTINGISYLLEEYQGEMIATVIPSEMGEGKYSGAITIPSTVKYQGEEYRVAYIEKGAFRDCTNLTSINVQRYIDGISNETFMGCTNLTSVTIDCASIGANAFNGCTKLKTLNLGNSLRYIQGSAFYGCTSLTSVVLPDNVQNIGSSAFAECSNLASVTLGPNVKTIDHHAFAFCKELTSIALPSSLTTLGDYAFSGCSKLASVFLDNPSIGSGVFNNCSAIRELHVDAETPPAIETFTFYGLDKSLCKLYVKSGAMSAYQTADVWKDFTDITDKRPRCAYPTIVTKEGKLQIECKTPNAVFHYKFTSPEFMTVGGLSFGDVYDDAYIMIDVHATATGYENSYPTSYRLSVSELKSLLQSGLKGDVNGDNQVNISDVTTLVNIILNKQ